MSKIEEAIEDLIQGHITDLDFSEVITSEVRDTWDMDELDRIDETVDRVDALEAWIVDAEDKLSIQNVINLENSVKNLVEHTNLLQMSIRDLEDRLVDYEKFLDMVQDVSTKKSFLSRLFFWR